ncbi:hypothetical protein DWY34_15390 [Blautia sp. AF25-12LB]|mgnify:FL=1|jgi:hypothetical protein|nr:hypothetical protein DWY34_15390 [Blautia sp. AF25-12LB]RHR12397.1 hypothetical protein DWX49_16325 [Blautia sp. AF19-34]RHU44685.1 hypothetical protein DXD15_07715 [Blautia sp. TF11-31AT]
MGKYKQIFCITKNTFLEERSSKRVIMGFVLGIALFGYWLNNFMQYVWDTGEPINILEAFIVVEHYNKNILFLVLGWLLIISDAPFIKGNTYLTLCRSSRKRWNIAMLQYIMAQAFLYVTCIAAVSVIVSCSNGYVGNMWSSPTYELAMDTTLNINEKYHISFSWINVLENMTVPQAFMITFAFLLLYLVALGILLYVCNLLLKEIYGILIVFGIQLSGYLLQQEGYANLSIMAKAIPGNSIDGSGGQWGTVSLFVVIILILAIISRWVIKRVDFKNVAEEE